MAETFLEELFRYVGFGDGDRIALQKFHPTAQPHFEAITETFYARVIEHPAAAAILRKPAVVERLQVSLRAWLELLLHGPWDEAYYQLRSRIGRIHVKVKLPQRYMLLAMSVIRQELEALVKREIAPAERPAILLALAKILDLELAIMLETYHEDYIAAVQRFERAGKSLLERRLAISEARYQAVIENAGVAIIAIDGDGKTVLFNRRAEEVSELGRDQAVGAPFVDTVCHPQHRGQMAKAIRDALEGHAGPAFEARLVTATGAERWLRWHLTTLATASEPLACAIGLDVTEERRLAARTKRAEGLASLGALAAGLAHEIRNPLNAAQLQLMLVDRRLSRLGIEDSAGASEAARVVRDELTRLAGLVEDFLAFARPIELRLAGGNLRETVRTVMTLLAPEAAQAGVALTAVPGDDVYARYDEERVKQVLINLVRNAIEAAGPGGAVELAVAREAATASIEVIDTGPGLPDGVPVFEPFTTTKETGTGLGLSIVHRIVGDHQGNVSFNRRDDRTVFRVELPVDGPTP